MKLLTVYAAHGDGGERGFGPIIGLFTSRASAKTAACGKGFYGADGLVRERIALHVNGKYFLLDSSFPKAVDMDGVEKERREKRRQELIKQLSDDDLDILGLEELPSEYKPECPLDTTAIRTKEK